jgi:DNA-binding transcriptional MerR regulator
MTTITEATKRFGLSTRTLRYYEQIGLISSERTDDYAYRVYSEDTLSRIQQIIVLRKLRIPLKSIADILKNGDARQALDIFMASIAEIDTEITALSTIRGILRQLTERLEASVHLGKRLDFLSDDLVEIVDTLAIVKPKIKEETSMGELNQATEKLNKLTDRDVRIIYLPPMTVASCQYTGDAPEGYVGEKIHQFVMASGLLQAKPDTRTFGFNHPNIFDETGAHGYEMWESIPDDWEVAAPLVKKTFPGGMYAAHMIPMGAFEEWGWLNQWLQESPRYAYNGQGNYVNMFDFLEETLNYPYQLKKHGANHDAIVEQLDLLMPIREKA